MKIRLVHPAIGEFSFPLVAGRPVIMGRAGSDVDVELNWDVRVSRRHARLSLIDGQVVVEDLGSRNGIWRGQDRLLGAHTVDGVHGILLGETVVTIPSEDALDLFLEEDTLSGLEPSPLEAAPIPAPVESADREPAYLSTMDLRLHSSDLVAPAPRPARVDAPATHLAPPPPPPPGPAAAARPAAASDTPRLPVGKFTSPDHVEVTLSGPTELKILWREHLARGGLFIETTETRALYHRLEVTLRTPGGSVSFPATVVHACSEARAKELGVPPGLGLQTTELSAAHKAAIQAYAEGMSTALVARTAPPRPSSNAELDTALALAKRLLEGLEKNEVYPAIDVVPEASDAVVQERIAHIAAQISTAARNAPANRAARLEAALLALGRLSHALGDPLRRLEHDLTRGHLRAEHRLAAAKSGTGPSLAELRRVWQQVAPDRVDRAAFLTRKAFTAKQRGDLDEAIRSAQQAMGENPFFDELRPTLTAWERQKNNHNDLRDIPTPMMRARR